MVFEILSGNTVAETVIEAAFAIISPYDNSGVKIKPNAIAIAMAEAEAEEAEAAAEFLYPKAFVSDVAAFAALALAEVALADALFSLVEADEAETAASEAFKIAEFA